MSSVFSGKKQDFSKKYLSKATATATLKAAFRLRSGMTFKAIERRIGKGLTAVSHRGAESAFRRQSLRFVRRIYTAKTAQNEYETALVESCGGLCCRSRPLARRTMAANSAAFLLLKTMLLVKKEMSVFFCDPNVPYQKPHIENNHTLPRVIFLDTCLLLLSCTSSGSRQRWGFPLGKNPNAPYPFRSLLLFHASHSLSSTVECGRVKSVSQGKSAHSPQKRSPRSFTQSRVKQSPEVCASSQPRQPPFRYVGHAPQ